MEIQKPTYPSSQTPYWHKSKQQFTGTIYRRKYWTLRHNITFCQTFQRHRASPTKCWPQMGESQGFRCTKCETILTNFDYSYNFGKVLGLLQLYRYNHKIITMKRLIVVAVLLAYAVWGAVTTVGVAPTWTYDNNFRCGKGLSNSRDCQCTDISKGYQFYIYNHAQFCLYWIKSSRLDRNQPSIAQYSQ